MSGERPTADLGIEREIDLRRWRDAALANWWIAAAGLVAGVVIGGLYALSGGTTYSATATIARGQAFNPAGTTVVLAALSSPLTIQTIATAPQTLDTVAKQIGGSANELRGTIATSVLGTTSAASGSSPSNPNGILLQITVTQNKAKRAEDAANAIAQIVKSSTTSAYVIQSISLYKVRLAHYAARVVTLEALIAHLSAVLKNPGSIAPLDQLVLANQLDSAQAALGSTLDSQTTTQQALTLAKDVETTQIVQLAKAQQVPGRSRRDSIVLGGVAGLLIGAIAALAFGLRARRSKSA